VASGDGSWPGPDAAVILTRSVPRGTVSSIAKHYRRDLSEADAPRLTRTQGRLICLVHFTGSGTQGDPKRPEYVPGPADKQDRSTIVAWSGTPTDDGSMVIVHVAAVDRNAFRAILADTRPEVKVFEIGVDSRQTIEAFMQKYKKGFSLDWLKVVAQ
jgi:hypothetical protein